MAEENGIELTLEQAKGYYTMLNPKAGALSDEELDNVAGGGCSGGQVPQKYHSSVPGYFK